MERWVQTCRHERLDRTLIWNERHLHRVLREFETHHNTHRPHQAIDRQLHSAQCPNPSSIPTKSPVSTYADTTDSAAPSTSTDMPLDQHGRDFRQAQCSTTTLSPTGRR
ncbi:hypothetical protein [Streptomyces sp. NPDC055105]|uniref:hypothetical protein n=1 Tax=Streptomyces sp. NPDC055105 TaxID=3365719 RepID=UPI0037CDF007